VINGVLVPPGIRDILESLDNRVQVFLGLGDARAVMTLENASPPRETTPNVITFKLDRNSNAFC
jgi:hypothetical protein